METDIPDAADRINAKYGIMAIDTTIEYHKNIIKELNEQKAVLESFINVNKRISGSPVIPNELTPFDIGRRITYDDATTEYFLESYTTETLTVRDKNGCSTTVRHVRFTFV